MKTRDIALVDKLRKRLPGGRRSLPGRAYGAGQEKIIFLLDRSGSMSMPDYPPTRFLAGAAAVEEFISARRKAHAYADFGLVVFESTAMIICEGCPLDKAHSEILVPLSATKTTGGTDIALGLTETHRIHAQREDVSLKRTILLTDGFGNAPENVARQMKRDGIVIDVIGIGGSPDAVNEASLREVASVIDGVCRYRFIGDRNSLVEHFRTIATDLVRSR